MYASLSYHCDLQKDVQQMAKCQVSPTLIGWGDRVRDCHGGLRSCMLSQTWEVHRNILLMKPALSWLSSSFLELSLNPILEPACHSFPVSFPYYPWYFLFLSACWIVLYPSGIVEPILCLPQWEIPSSTFPTNYLHLQWRTLYGTIVFFILCLSSLLDCESQKQCYEVYLSLQLSLNAVAEVHSRHLINMALKSLHQVAVCLSFATVTKCIVFPCVLENAG